MAVVVEQQVRYAGRVAAAAARSYAVVGDLVSEMPLGDVPGVPASAPAVTAVVAPANRRIEIVLDHEDEPDHLAAAIHALAGAGWDVVVLAPGAVLGAAHGSLRGVPCRLQVWWLDGDAVRFGSPELP